jgi:hypothetical protein
MDAACQIEDGAWIRVTYNSSRAEDRQVVEGKVNGVKLPRNGDTRDRKIVFTRSDDQKMEVRENDCLISYGSHYATTGFATRYEIKIR